MMRRFLLLVTLLICLLGAVTRSPQWRSVRAAHIQANPRCVVCGSEATQVHHVVPFSRDPSRELDPTNLRSVCDSCHLRIAHLGCWQNYNPDFDKHAKMLREAKEKADAERRARK